jgi:hypothetical protein
MDSLFHSTPTSERVQFPGRLEGDVLLLSMVLGGSVIAQSYEEVCRGEKSGLWAFPAVYLTVSHVAKTLNVLPMFGVRTPSRTSDCEFGDVLF